MVNYKLVTFNLETITKYNQQLLRPQNEYAQCRRIHYCNLD